MHCSAIDVPLTLSTSQVQRHRLGELNTVLRQLRCATSDRSAERARARCVPDRPVDAGYSRSLTDSPVHWLTCEQPGRPAAQTDLLSNGSRAARFGLGSHAGSHTDEQPWDARTLADNRRDEPEVTNPSERFWTPARESTDQKAGGSISRAWPSVRTCQGSRASCLVRHALTRRSRVRYPTCSPLYP
jgi:hypothetical protein